MGSNILSLVIFAAVVALAASFGASFRPGAWYVTLAKPAWTPPNWIFGPVWTALYAGIAIAGWLAWRHARSWFPLVLWGTGLALNAAWSWLFFGAHTIGGALMDIALLWCTIASFIVATWSVSRPASLLFVPYLAWVSFASALNLAIWLLNR